MTKAEKITISISAIAVLISIATPIATYLWLDPKVKEFNERARLQVTVDDPNKDLDSSMSSWDPYKINILNIGKLPAKDIQIVIRFKTELPAFDYFEFDPPLQYEIHSTAHESFITLKRPLASQDSLNMIFYRGVPSLLTVSTDTGETSTINTGYESIGPAEGKEIKPNKKVKSTKKP